MYSIIKQNQPNLCLSLCRLPENGLFSPVGKTTLHSQGVTALGRPLVAVTVSSFIVQSKEE